MTTYNLLRKIPLSRFVGLAALLVLGGAVAHAQEAPAPPAAPGVPGDAPTPLTGRRGGGRQRVNPAVEAFRATKPTPDQELKFANLQAKMRDDMQALQGQSDAREKIQDINKKFTDDVEALLTPEQQKTFRLEVAKAQGNLLGQMESLDLTNEEKQKVRPLVRDAQEALQKLRQDNTLSPDDRKTKTNATVADLKAKVRPLLTSEQQTKLDALDLKVAAPRGRRNGGGRFGGNGNANAGGNAGAPPPPLAPER